MRIPSILILILMTVGLTGQAQTLSFETGVKFKKLGETTFSELAADQSLSLQKGESYFIFSKQGLPILVYSALDRRSTLKITEPDLSMALHEQLQSQLNQSLNELLNGIQKTEALMQKRDYANALAMVGELKNKFPQISSVLFLSGTLHYLNKNQSSAIEDLEKGLALDPNNVTAKKLYSELRGQKP